MSNPSPLQVIKDEHQKIMQLKPDDSMVFEITASIMLAALAPSLLEPIWVYFIGPPGSGKTESIIPYDGCPFTMFVSTLTESTLASGFRDDDGKDRTDDQAQEQSDQRQPHPQFPPASLVRTR